MEHSFDKTIYFGYLSVWHVLNMSQLLAKVQNFVGRI